MISLAILRHAKSSSSDDRLDDFDRPLNERGREAARLVGRELRSRGLAFDQVIASPAVRVRETLDELVRGYGEELDVRFEPRLYGADVGTLLDLVGAIPDEVRAPLLVGHNPGLQQMVLTLTEPNDSELRQRVMAKFPTAALALIELPAARWDEVAAESGVIRELILPRELGD